MMQGCVKSLSDWNYTDQVEENEGSEAEDDDEEHPDEEVKIDDNIIALD